MTNSEMAERIGVLERQLAERDAYIVKLELEQNELIERVRGQR